MFLVVFATLASFPVTEARCDLSKNCWNTGCTATVTASPWKAGLEAVVSVGQGGRIASHEVWNAKIVRNSGSQITMKLNKWANGSFGFNVRGTTTVSVLCDGDTGTADGTTDGGRSESSSHGEDDSDGAVSQSSRKYPLMKPTVTLRTGSAVLSSFMDKLSSVVGRNSVGNIRVVQSSGGAAGGVISEGQGYGLLIAATTAASTTNNRKKNDAIKASLEFFNGWRTMCRKSNGSGSCQTGGYCEGFNCLPHWKFDDRLSRVVGTGAAPDGDEDAILGMILLLGATKGKGYAWWNNIEKWACDSCRAFMDFNTVAGSGGKLTLKLGTCWGGWDCSNPSYFAPAHWRAFRDYMKSCNSKFGGTDYTDKWNKLIKTTYEILEANQCPQTGLTTNWWKPSQSDPSHGGSASCNGSGTPAAEFGSEASRGVWRVTLDYLWYKDEANQGVGAGEYAARVAKAITNKVNTRQNLDTGCHVQSVFRDWLQNPFIWAPTGTALLVNTKTPGQQKALNKIANKLRSTPINDYYSGSWIALETLTMNGDFLKAKDKLL